MGSRTRAQTPKEPDRCGQRTDAKKEGNRGLFPGIVGIIPCSFLECNHYFSEAALDKRRANPYNNSCLSTHNVLTSFAAVSNAFPAMPNPKQPRSLCRCGCEREVARPGWVYYSLRCQHDTQYQEYIDRWKAALEEGCIPCGRVSRHVRRYLLETHGERCMKCGWNERHPQTGVVPLEVEHIDGNWQNSREANLLLLCPNCHALTPTFRNLNKGRGRESRRKAMQF